MYNPSPPSPLSAEACFFADLDVWYRPPMADDPGIADPAERLVTLERRMAELLLRINEAQRRGLDARALHAVRVELQREIDALRPLVYGSGNPTPLLPPRRPSGLLRRVIEHTARAAEELARRPAAIEPVPSSEAVTPVPDPLRMAAAMIVGHITANPDASLASHEAYVLAILRELTEPVKP